jgi:hypothetical protein
MLFNMTLLRLIKTFLLLIPFNLLIGQTDNDLIVLKIDKYMKRIVKRQDGIVELSLINKSMYPIIIPSSLLNKSLSATPKPLDFEIFYEIIYCNNKQSDTIFKKDDKIGVDINYINPERYAVLERSKSKKVICYLDYGYFKKVGTYKIRFCFQASKLNKHYSDVYSDWIELYLADTNFFEKE